MFFTRMAYVTLSPPIPLGARIAEASGLQLVDGLSTMGFLHAHEGRTPEALPVKDGASNRGWAPTSRCQWVELLLGTGGCKWESSTERKRADAEYAMPSTRQPGSARAFTHLARITERNRLAPGKPTGCGPR
jgi:hypothetical protein